MTKRAQLFSLSFLFLAIVISLLGSISTVGAQTLTSATNLKSGDLIRGQSLSGVYYYGDDGLRYVFPNDKTYFTWYSNFDSVKWISDADLASIQIGGNVTYRPGVRMIKITSDERVYAISSGGTLRHVGTEPIAAAIFGANWNKMIDDVQDGLFSNYKMGSAIEIASSYSLAAEKADAFSINADKDLRPYMTVSITDNGYSDDDLTVPVGTAIRFVNTGSMKHTASSDSGKWGTGTLATGKHFTRVFKEEGEFSYHCAYHDFMTGTITVE